MHTVAVHFDLVQPVGAFRRRFDERRSCGLIQAGGDFSSPFAVWLLVGVERIGWF